MSINLLEPLVRNVTRNFQPCRGCGKNYSSSDYDKFFQKKRGENMTFIVQVKVDAERVSVIDSKSIEESCGGEVISINPRPQPPQMIRPTPPIKLDVGS